VLLCCHLPHLDFKPAHVPPFRHTPQVHSRNKKLDGEVDLKEVAMRTPGFSGADLSNLMNEAAILAGRRGLAVSSGRGRGRQKWSDVVSPAV
jgi:hypothetical protein